MLTGCMITEHEGENYVKPDLEKAAQLNVQLGLGYLQRQNVERAKTRLLKALEQAPNSPIALDAMAYYLEVTGDQENA